jgi:Rrf2 family protein
LLSKTAQYALRAIVFIARHGEARPVLARSIAARTGIPLHYLLRILNAAVREGLLVSARGVGGGFRLARPRRQMRLVEVIGPFDDLIGKSRCPFGEPRCDDAHPCGFHAYWKPVATAYRAMLEDTTLDQLTTAGLERTRTRAARRKSSAA